MEDGFGMEVHTVGAKKVRLACEPHHLVKFFYLKTDVGFGLMVTGSGGGLAKA